MIVKNEEQNIERALSWGRDIMFEQIVVDTGSTDRTVELARQMGAKVFHFEWINDFAAAKNYAIEQAQGNWIAFLDADEYFVSEMASKLPLYLQELHYSKIVAVVTEWLNLDDAGKVFCGGTQMRLFRNLRGLRYFGRIHEALTYHGKALTTDNYVDASEQLSILHDGYKQSVAGQGEKGKRNRPLILKELEEDPENSILMGYMGDCYGAEGEPELAVEWYEKAIAAMDSVECEADIRISTTFANLLFHLAKKDDEQRLMEIYHMATRKIPTDADFDYNVGRYFAHKQDFGKAAFYLERALNLLNQYGDSSQAAHLTGNLPGTWELLAVCHYNNNEMDKCVSCCVTLLKSQKYIMTTLAVLLTAFRNEPPAAVLQFLGYLYDFNSLKDRVFVLKASMQVGFEELTAAVRDTLSSEEQKSFDRATAGE